MFSKISKKNLIIAASLIVVILLVGLTVVYIRGLNKEMPTENKPNNVDSETNIPKADIEVESGNSSGLTICLDECGNGVCQTSDPNCTENSNLNCICPETSQECPQDCK